MAIIDLGRKRAIADIQWAFTKKAITHSDEGLSGRRAGKADITA